MINLKSIIGLACFHGSSYPTDHFSCSCDNIVVLLEQEIIYNVRVLHSWSTTVIVMGGMGGNMVG